ncbi:MAG TPA: RidA family protein [Hanamia sp.]|nr:RidA family protein [Hanamia sp.]
MPHTPEKNLIKSGFVLPPPPKPAGVYKPLLQVDNLIYVSGHGPVLEDGTLIIGKVAYEINQDEAKMAARQVGLTILSTLKANLGSLDKIKRVIKVFGMVNCTLNFEQHPFVINGCSELFAEIWGSENGVGVRSAVGMGSLPGNIPVEIEAIFELA